MENEVHYRVPELNMFCTLEDSVNIKSRITHGANLTGI